MEYLFNHQNGIKFRKVGQNDLDDLTNLKNESWYGTHRISIVNRDNQDNWLAALNKEDIHTPRNLVLIAANNDNNIGIYKILNICWQSRFASVGWDVYKEHRNRGFGKKLVEAGRDFCFQVLNLHRISAEILESNHASQRCAELAGFIQEGCQVDVVWRNGQWIDNLLYGLVSND